MIFDPLKKEEKELIFLYTTCPTRDEARAIAFAAVKEKLVVCCDYWAVDSIYPWNGVLEDIDQYMLLLTTTKGLSDKLYKFILSMHSYSIPMIAESPIKIKNPAYTLWGQNIIKDTTDYISMEEKKKKDAYEAEGNFHPGRLK
jgi:periplasmic divalent cation tolerance protein